MNSEGTTILKQESTWSVSREDRPEVEEIDLKSTSSIREGKSAERQSITCSCRVEDQSGFIGTSAPLRFEKYILYGKYLGYSKYALTAVFIIAGECRFEH